MKNSLSAVQKETARTQRAVLYCRVSTAEQEKGNSLDWQEEYLRKYCQARHIEVDAVFKDDKTGKTFDGRVGFKELMQHCKKNKGNIDYVFVYRWDRYSRNVQHALNNLEQFKKLGIEVNAAEQHIDFNTTDWITILSIHLSMAESEDNKISRRTRECIHKARENGKCVHKAPLGYINRQIDDDSRYVEVNEKLRDYIIESFQEVSKGVMTTDAVRRKMNRKGFKIHKNTFLKMLRNRFYVGEIFVPEYKDGNGTIRAHYVKGLHEPIIYIDTFNSVQEVLDGKRRKTPKTSKVLHPDLFLRKYLRCPVCGGSMTGSGSKGNGGKYYYYHCNKDGKHFRFRANEANDMFRRYVAQLKPNKEILLLYNEVLIDIREDKNKDVNKEILSLQSELAKCQTREASVSDKYMDGEIDSETYNRLCQQIKDTRKKVEDKLNMLQTGKGSVLEPQLKYSMLLISNLERFMEDAPVEVKCMVIGSMFPEKLDFDGKQYRTNSYNAVLDLIYRQTNMLRGNKKGDSSDYSEKSPKVPPQGLEPWTPTLRVSCSTN